MRCIVVKYFKDDAGTWHQPGEPMELDNGEARQYEAKNLVHVQTRMTAPPRTRRKKDRALA